MIYSEIHVLRKMLDAAEIPYEMNPLYNGYQIAYPKRENFTCSVIEHDFSYGSQIDTLEIMGLLTDDEVVYDDVLGCLTAEEVFNRINTDWKKRGEE